MFNPQTSIDFSTFWEFIGSFYKAIPEESKLQMQTIWKAYVEGLETLYFDMAQANDALYFEKHNGWIESGLWETRLVFKDLLNKGRENVQNIYLTPPVSFITYSSVPLNSADTLISSYKITSYNSTGESKSSKEVILTSSVSVGLLSDPNEISFSAQTNATGYYLYKRNPSGVWKRVASSSTPNFVDNGTLPFGTEEAPIVSTGVSYYKVNVWDTYSLYWLWISDIKLLETGESLTGWTLKNGRELWFPYTVSVDTDRSLYKLGGTYRIESGVALLPSLENIYLPMLWTGTKSEWFDTYTPWYTDWNSDPETQWKNHIGLLKSWCWGLQYWLNQPPTLNTLKQAWAILLGYPFSDEKSLVTDITGNTVTLSGNTSGVRTYDFTGYDFLYAENDWIDPFHVFISGVSVIDYYKDSAAISTISGLYPTQDPSSIILFEDNLQLVTNEALKDSFIKKLSPAGLLAHY